VLLRCGYVGVWAECVWSPAVRRGVELFEIWSCGEEGVRCGFCEEMDFRDDENADAPRRRATSCVDEITDFQVIWTFALGKQRRKLPD
jgi:hypothetical protein